MKKIKPSPSKLPVNASANRLLQACVVYVFFFGVTITSTGVSVLRYVTGEDTVVMTIFNVVTLLLAGTLAALSYRDLQDYLRPKPHHEATQQPEQLG
ncbi:hypothetical protein [Pseudomonas putida]|uniref:Uncharacterized protein n=1 Tax=Pseudomonas putida TaxID=303 RepID=A0A7V8EIT4_PSEPU|nr:hypothetical protein [Pseudomonas putida]KAF0255645.1 hypothetical protein GN299_06020 [Pseudomonas putida]